MSIGYAKANGYEEVETTAGEVKIGSLIAGGRKSDVWEIIDMAHPAQVEDLHTLWWKARHVTTGEEVSIPPRAKSATITVLVKPDEVAEPFRGPSDADQIMLLVEKLGASVIARKDTATGEVTCPNYEEHWGWSGDNRQSREYDQHLLLAHNIDVSAIPPEDVGRRVELHGQAHDPKFPAVGKTGFPHRHIPEPRQNVYAYAGVAT